jgi:hypothetical protein
MLMKILIVAKTQTYAWCCRSSQTLGFGQLPVLQQKYRLWSLLMNKMMKQIS